MATTNDITGDVIKSRASTAYADNYDRIFRKGNTPKANPVDAELQKVLDQLLQIANLCGRHDKMQHLEKLEKAYRIIEEIKNPR